MYKHARAPIRHSPPVAKSEEANRFRKGEALLLRFVQEQGIFQSAASPREARRCLREAGVSVFLDRLPKMIFVARDPLAAYRYWCDIMRFRDETKKTPLPKNVPKTIRRFIREP